MTATIECMCIVAALDRADGGKGERMCVGQADAGKMSTSVCVWVILSPPLTAVDVGG